MRKNISLTLYYEVYLHGSKLIQNLHDLAAASGDHIALLHVHQLMADGAINVTFFFCPNHAVQAAFQFIFHSCFPLQKGRELPPALRYFIVLYRIGRISSDSVQFFEPGGFRQILCNFSNRV